MAWPAIPAPPSSGPTVPYPPVPPARPPYDPRVPYDNTGPYGQPPPAPPAPPAVPPTGRPPLTPEQIKALHRKNTQGAPAPPDPRQAYFDRVKRLTEQARAEGASRRADMRAKSGNLPGQGGKNPRLPKPVPPKSGVGPPTGGTASAPKVPPPPGGTATAPKVPPPVPPRSPAERQAEALRRGMA